MSSMVVRRETDCGLRAAVPSVAEAPLSVTLSLRVPNLGVGSVLLRLSASVGVTGAKPVQLPL